MPPDYLHSTPLPPLEPYLHLVVAVARGGVIGHAGGLPWHIPEDLKHFKALTMGRTIIMGRKTFESIGRVLPGRRTLVISRSRIAGVLTFSSLPAALEAADAFEATHHSRPDAPFIVGGASIYQAALPLCAVAHVTEIDRDFEGDTFFPALDPFEWVPVSRRVSDTDENVSFVEWHRRRVY